MPSCIVCTGQVYYHTRAIFGRRSCEHERKFVFQAQAGHDLLRQLCSGY
jgi:hypothetical protein